MKKQLSHNYSYNLIFNKNKSPVPTGVDSASQKSNQKPQRHPTLDSDKESLDSLDWDSMSSESNGSDDELVQTYDRTAPFTIQKSPLGTRPTAMLRSPLLTQEYMKTLGNGCCFYTTNTISTSPWRITQDDITLPTLTDKKPYSHKQSLYHKGFRYRVVTPTTIFDKKKPYPID